MLKKSIGIIVLSIVGVISGLWFNASVLTANAETCTHAWERVTRKEATCTETGLWEWYCPLCGEGDIGDEGGVIPALGHVQTDVWTQTAPATCTEPGWQAHICSRCNAEYEWQRAPEAAHKWQRVTRKEPTCTETGLWEWYCTVCGEGDIGDEGGVIAALGHNYTVTAETAATCNNRGSRTSTCSRCNDVKIEKIPATGNHVWSAAQTIAATCETPGYTIRTCTVCGTAEDSNHTSALGHSYTLQSKTPEAFKHAADCTRAETYYYTCSRCGDVRKDDWDGETLAYTAPTWTVGEPLGHVWEKDQDRPATCVQNGEYHYTCTRCGGNDHGIYPALGHNYGSDNVCTRCGGVKGTTPCAPGTHNYVNGQCTICGEWNTEFAVKFMTHDFKTYKIIGVNTGETVALPDPPMRKGYQFVTWKYYDEKGNFVKFTDETICNGEITVYPVYNPVYITITVTDGLTGEAIEVKVLEDHSLDSCWTPPRHTGYRFTGYTRDGAGEAYDSSKIITTSISITANYEITMLGRFLNFLKGAGIWILIGVAIVVILLIYVFSNGTTGGKKRRRK